MNTVTTYKGLRVTEVRISTQRPGERYGGEDVAKLAECEFAVVAEFCEAGYIEPAGVSGNQFLFDDEAVYLVRRLHGLRTDMRLPNESLALIADLMRQVRALESEVRTLRERM